VKRVSEQSELHLAQKVDDIFDNIVKPLFEKFIENYGGTSGFEVKLVPDGPLIMGIKRYSSIMFRYPNGLEMIVCVYWVSGSQRLIAENIRMVTRNKTFDIFSIRAEELEKQIRFLAGLEL
jgi:hypothetical protein